MKRTLVNHGGIIQWKFLISNDEELMQYAKHKSIAISEEFRHLINKNYKGSDKEDTNTQKVLKLTSKIHQVPLVASCDVLLKNVIISMYSMILEGETLVVNQAGGYCPWDDSCMTLVKETENNIAIANGDEPKDQILADLEHGPILVLENQSEIPEKVEDYIHLTLGLPSFSYIKNIQFDKAKFIDLIKEALVKKHHTFITQTTMMDTNQVEMIAGLLEKIPNDISFLINTSEDVEKTLTQIIGAERTKAIFEKHKIIQF